MNYQQNITWLKPDCYPWGWTRFFSFRFRLRFRWGRYKILYLRSTVAPSQCENSPSSETIRRAKGELIKQNFTHADSRTHIWKCNGNFSQNTFKIGFRCSVRAQLSLQSEIKSVKLWNNLFVTQLSLYEFVVLVLSKIRRIKWKIISQKIRQICCNFLNFCFWSTFNFSI